MTPKQMPYKVISTPPLGYKLPDSFWKVMIHKAMEKNKKVVLKNAGNDDY